MTRAFAELDLAALDLVDETTLTGDLALRIETYVAEPTRTRQEVVADLDVVCLESGARALYHPRSGLYGFLRLPHDRPLTLRITDPTRAHVARAARATVPPIAANRPAILVRPGPEAPRRPTETAIWGFVGDSSGKPLVFGRVEVALWLPATPTSAKWDRRFVTTTDEMGSYRAVFDGLAPTADELGETPDAPPPPARARVSVNALKRPAPPSDPLAALLPDFDGLEPSAGAPGSFETQFVTPPKQTDFMDVDRGGATRIDLTIES